MTDMACTLTLSPIIKVVGTSCNLRCGYCFFNGCQDQDIHVMDEGVLMATLSQLMVISPRRIHFIWHGGEPLLAGKGFYQKVIDIQRRFSLPEQIVINSIQTNGTLVTDDWAMFFKENDFKIGVSLDGPKHIHDQVRVNTVGKGSFAKVMNGINILRKYGLCPGVIAVINSHNVRYPDDIFHFFRRQKLQFSANECYASSDSHCVTKTLAVDLLDYVIFLLKVFDLWVEADDPTYHVKPLTDIVRAVMGQQTSFCKLNAECHRYITIDSDGTVYPCNAYPRPELAFGNLSTENIQHIFELPIFNNHYSKREVIRQRCHSCKWSGICLGWCMRTWDNWMTTQGPRNNQSCEALQVLFGGINDKLKALGYSTIF